MTSAESITRSAGAPRAALLDYPLGHTAGKPNEPAEQREIVHAALRLFETLDVPGEIARLPFSWSDDESWKTPPSRSAAASESESGGESGNDAAAQDDRTERLDAPEYQTADDRMLAEQALASGDCATCVFFED